MSTPDLCVHCGEDLVLHGARNLKCRTGKTVFNTKKMKGINDMQPHQERVVTEKTELDEKLAKLKEFCFGSNTKIFGSLDPQERDRLERQYDAMKLYSGILDERIANFK